VAAAASTAILGAWVGSANAARHWIATLLGACEAPPEVCRASQIDHGAWLTPCSGETSRWHSLRYQPVSGRRRLAL
jgi:hypothetical protein